MINYTLNNLVMEMKITQCFKRKVFWEITYFSYIKKGLPRGFKIRHVLKWFFFLLEDILRKPSMFELQVAGISFHHSFSKILFISVIIFLLPSGHLQYLRIKLNRTIILLRSLFVLGNILFWFLKSVKTFTLHLGICP